MIDMKVIRSEIKAEIVAAADYCHAAHLWSEEPHIDGTSVMTWLLDQIENHVETFLAAAEARAERLESLYRHERDEYRPDEPGRPLLTEDYDEETEAAIKDAKEQPCPNLWDDECEGMCGV